MKKNARHSFIRAVAGISLFGLVCSSALAVDLAISQRKLSNLELFSRCYAHITQLRLSLTHPLRAGVIAGTITPINACMQILGEANLNAAGGVAATTNVGTTNESLAVLRNFDSYHHTMTENPDLDGSVPSGADYRFTRVIYDEGEFGLHFTRALFTPGASISDVVKLSSGLEALRSNGSLASMTSNITDPVFTYNAPTVQMGGFIGVRTMTSNATKTALSATFGNRTFLVHKSDGGGVLGTPAYLLANFGRDINELSNGGVVLPRRLSRAIFKDLLCRDLPVIRQSDAAGFVQTTVTASTPPFRKGVSCMGCHASMDPMASVARNVTMILDFQNPNTTHAVHPYRNPASLSAETGVVDADPNFYKRPTNGRLVFRSYDGSFVDQAVTSIADLGAKIADTNDFYACTAARYYKFFTGITVNLQDAGDTNLPPISSADLFYRSEVIKMGQNLKTSQNLQSLIREILNSDVYQRASNRGSN